MPRDSPEERFIEYQKLQWSWVKEGSEVLVTCSDRYGKEYEVSGRAFHSAYSNKRPIEKACVAVENVVHPEYIPFEFIIAIQTRE